MDKIQIAVEIENVDMITRTVSIKDDDVGPRLGVRRSLAVGVVGKHQSEKSWWWA